MRTSQKKQITRVGCYGVIVKDGSVLLCRLSATERTNAGKWTLPGGGADFGEDPVKAMIREVREETGLKVLSQSLLGVRSEHFDNTFDEVHAVQIVFRAEVADGDLVHELEGSTDQCAWIPLDEVANLPVVPLTAAAMAWLNG